MNIIDNYNHLPITRLQQTRLYLQSKPLLSIWRKQCRGTLLQVPEFVQLIDQQITGNFIAIDCAGWIFNNQQRQCTAIEIHQNSTKYWNNIHFEYDYLTWHPTYLPPVTVLAYYSTYFKYSDLTDFLTFCKVWSGSHPKLIIGLDPTKVKFNYLKEDLLSLVIKKLPHCKINCVIQENFNLLFTIESP